MAVERFVTPAGVVVEMKAEAAERIGFQPEPKQKRVSAKKEA